ncbi:HalOD1 output domain-containing protein [Halapricum hydrolyticum]|uniref:Halobacterial output domain-containing protein n=1 Tax=Halapricum hydrolyticum TaxID=2979991 RepID=A0AAE3LEI6_9EURY|nr:HalOD1 output domain-containing protein [Halapricum hydrolyticum]MCU4726406.1 hypothetical protein [Halapricum hydrolyticum]
MGTHPDEIAITVIETASDALKVPIEELPPLSDAIDVDALEAIATSPLTTPQSTVTVTFTYAGLHVFVSSEKIVYVRPINSQGMGINNSVGSGDW